MRRAILLFILALAFLLLAFLTYAQTMPIREQFAQAVYPALHHLAETAPPPPPYTFVPTPTLQFMRPTPQPWHCFVQMVEPPIVVCPDVAPAEDNQGR